MRKKINYLILSIIILSISSCTNNVSIYPVQLDKEWGYIDINGKFVTNPQFQKAYFINDGMGLFLSEQGKYGYVDSEGQIAIPAIYEEATCFNKGVAFVTKEDEGIKCINKKGEVINNLDNYELVSQMTDDGYAIIRKDKGGLGFIDISGKETMINIELYSMSSFSEGLIAFEKSKDGNWGYINTKGEIEINPQFDKTFDFHEGLAAFCQSGKWGYINKKGEYVINPQFESASDFSEGIALIQQGGKYGYINKEGKIIINPQFDAARPFKSGLAAVYQGGKWGYIDKNGSYIINPQYLTNLDFINDITFVYVESDASKGGIINKKGKYIVNPQFKDVNYQIFNSYYINSHKIYASKFIDKICSMANSNSFDYFTPNSQKKDIKEKIERDEVNYGLYFSNIDNGFSVDGITLKSMHYKIGTNSKILAVEYTFENESGFSPELIAHSLYKGLGKKIGFNDIHIGITNKDKGCETESMNCLYYNTPNLSICIEYPTPDQYYYYGNIIQLSIGFQIYEFNKFCGLYK